MVQNSLKIEDSEGPRVKSEGCGRMRRRIRSSCALRRPHTFALVFGAESEVRSGIETFGGSPIRRGLQANGGRDGARGIGEEHGVGLALIVRKNVMHSPDGV